MVHELWRLKNQQQQLQKLFSKNHSSENHVTSESERLAMTADKFDIQFQEIQGGKIRHSKTADMIYNIYIFRGSFIKLVAFLNQIEKSNEVFLVHADFWKEQELRAEPELDRKSVG